MKRIMTVLTVTVVLVGCAAPPTVFVKRSFNFHSIKNVGVLPFNVPDQMKGKTGGVVAADMFSTQLLGLGFSVIDRSDIQKSLGEMKLDQSGAIDPATAQSVGKIIGVDAVVMGTITPAVVMDDESVGVTGPLRRREVMVSEDVPTVDVTNLNVVAKMVLVETGEILWSASAERNSSSGQASLQSAIQAISVALKKQIQL